MNNILVPRNDSYTLLNFVFNIALSFNELEIGHIKNLT